MPRIDCKACGLILSTSEAKEYKHYCWECVP